VVFIFISGKEIEPKFVWEREKADNSVPAFLHESVTTGTKAAEWPSGLRYLPRVYYYCQLVHSGLNAVASLAALNHCTSIRKKRKDLKSFCLVKSFKTK